MSVPYPWPHTGPTRPLEAASEAGPKADYEKTLWRPALQRRVPPPRAPDPPWQAHKPLDAAARAEQRLAHHEPVFARPLREDHDRILEVTGAESRLTCGRGSSSSSRVPRLLDAADGVTDIDF